MTVIQAYLLQNILTCLTDCDFKGHNMGTTNLAFDLFAELESVVVPFGEYDPSRIWEY